MKRQGKYPRRTMINGSLHVVRNGNEERRLLQTSLDRSNDAAKVAKALGDKPLEEQIRARSIRINKRVGAVASREDEWRTRLIAEDDEILLFYQ